MSVVRSTGTGERFEYGARVTDAVKPAKTGPDRTDPPDRIEMTENGTFLRGEVGDGFGDRYLVWGDVTGFEATTSTTNYEYGFV